MCSQDFNQNIENGFNILESAGYWAANDFEVAEGKIFKLDQVTLSTISIYGGGPTTFSMSIYKNGDNVPGELLVNYIDLKPIDQSIIQDYGDAHIIYSSLLELNEPLTLPSGKYWLAITAGESTNNNAIYWSTSSSSNGFPFLISTNGGYSWISKEGTDGIFSVIGQCEDILATNDSSLSTISYYPNPVKDILNIKTDKKIGSVSVYNLAGQKVIGNAKVMNGQINLSSLVTGIYMVQITLENGEIKTFKIIKE